MRALCSKLISLKHKDIFNLSAKKNTPAVRNFSLPLYSTSIYNISSLNNNNTDATEQTSADIFSTLSRPGSIIRNFVTLDFQSLTDHSLTVTEPVALDTSIFQEAFEKTTKVKTKTKTISANKEKKFEKNKASNKSKYISPKKNVEPYLVTFRKHVQPRAKGSFSISRTIHQLMLETTEITATVSSEIFAYIIEYNKTEENFAEKITRNTLRELPYEVKNSSALEKAINIIYRFKTASISFVQARRSLSIISRPVINISALDEKLEDLENFEIEEFIVSPDLSAGSPTPLIIVPVNFNAVPVLKRTVSPIVIDNKSAQRKAHAVAPVEKRGDAGDRPHDQ